MSANFTSGEWATWDSPLMKNRGVTGPTAAAAMTATADITRNGYAKWSEVLTTDKKQVAITLGITQDEAHANARLIAAAPTMYAYVASSAANGCAEAKRIMEAIYGL